tara:strand:- start:86 stop:250 length:165 start_codon:yes stop_codon:yes gene_type:complete
MVGRKNNKKYHGPLTFWLKIIAQAIVVGLALAAIGYFVTQFTGDAPPISQRTAN